MSFLDHIKQRRTIYAVGKNVAFFNDSLQDSNFFDDIFGDTGETLTAKIKIEYENVYGYKLGLVEN